VLVRGMKSMTTSPSSTGGAAPGEPPPVRWHRLMYRVVLVSLPRFSWKKLNLKQSCTNRDADPEPHSLFLTSSQYKNGKTRLLCITWRTSNIYILIFDRTNTNFDKSKLLYTKCCAFGSDAFSTPGSGIRKSFYFRIPDPPMSSTRSNNFFRY